MEIKPIDVKNLREKTGAGMGDCKKALIEAEGNIEQAIKILKEKGLAAAAKRSARATKEGKIFTKIKGGKAVILELNCETDFVSRNEKFVALGDKLTDEIIATGATAVTDGLSTLVTEAIGVIKENMTLPRFKVLDIADDEYAVEYVHGVGNIGVLVKFKADNKALFANDAVKTFAFDCALHVAAFAPVALSPDKISESYIKEQTEIFQAQMDQDPKVAAKPDQVKAGILKGKLNKHFAEICFLDQAFVKDDKKKVSQVMAEVAKAAGGKLEVAEYVYYKLGDNA
ncbi:MAG: elongation factor Ts [Spirochaetia bacterium]|nr:elongation factor Ts [Spirochaetia bacterium]MBQ3713245.1 elongation factor Ts [Spirochaetia bacterium]MBQ6673769.1 elongation factor Ts [Spirochaetia bacterium]MBR0319079.1 elongation factor Ts [Spirochaetia bacterium]